MGDSEEALAFAQEVNDEADFAYYLDEDIEDSKPMPELVSTLPEFETLKERGITLLDCIGSDFESPEARLRLVEAQQELNRRSTCLDDRQTQLKQCANFAVEVIQIVEEKKAGRCRA